METDLIVYSIKVHNLGPEKSYTLTRSMYLQEFNVNNACLQYYVLVSASPWN